MVGLPDRVKFQGPNNNKKQPIIYVDDPNKVRNEILS